MAIPTNRSPNMLENTMPPSRMLENKICLVTGGASGIGRAVVKLLAAEGAEGVVIADIDEGAAKEVAESLPIEAIPVRTDVSEVGNLDDVVSEVLERWGRLDCAANVAGIAGPLSRLGEYPLEAWQSVIATNLNGVFFAMRAELNAMVKRKSGTIVNVASGAAVLPRVGLGPYSASKAGVVAITKAAAGEYSRDGIRINVVLPGSTRTPLWEANLGPDPEETLRRYNEAAPMGRVGGSEELAEAVVWLLSDRSSYVLGAELLVDGGQHSFTLGHTK